MHKCNVTYNPTRTLYFPVQKKRASTKWECIFKMNPSISSKENTSLNSNYSLGRMFSFSFLVLKNKGEFKFPKPDKQIQTSFEIAALQESWMFTTFINSSFCFHTLR